MSDYEIVRSPKVIVAVMEAGEYIHSLPLTSDQHNTLTNLLVEQTKTAEENAFKQGFASALFETGALNGGTEVLN